MRLQLALARETIRGLDVAEESRALTSQERDLRRTLKVRTLGLASLARTIYRQRSRVTFLREGDTNNRFFHLHACHRRRANRTDSLVIEGAETVADTLMAQGLYEHYSNLLGTPFARSRRFDLAQLGMPSIDLAVLENLITEEEVRRVVMALPNDKAPGPDGFTGRFFKLAWDIVKADLMEAINAFWAADGRSFAHVNGTLMVLLKKVDEPTAIKDYRPISLIHSFAKLLTKCLANRLAPFLDQLISKNQSAFIKGRSIHDNFRSVRLSCKALHAGRARCVLLKIDIAKAFDTVAWPFLIEIMEFMGFGQRWRDWLSILLGTANTKIMLNGRPGRRICHARGLRQGDPLSPMLFLLAMEVINRAIHGSTPRECSRRWESVACIGSAFTLTTSSSSSSPIATTLSPSRPCCTCSGKRRDWWPTSTRV